jgi:hypothetical protein
MGTSLSLEMPGVDIEEPGQNVESP